MHLVECPAQGSFVWQVLEEIAGEHDVQTRFFNRPRLGTVLPDALNIARRVAWCIGIEIYGVFTLGVNLIDELSLAAPQVENHCIMRDVLLEE